jgi:hypothetical protein
LREKRKIILEGAGADPFSLLREKTRKKSRGRGGRLPRVQERKKSSALRVFFVAFFNCKIPPPL